MLFSKGKKDLVRGHSFLGAPKFFFKKGVLALNFGSEAVKK